MTRIELLDESVGFPLDLPQTPGHHSGVPSAVADKAAATRPWHLVAWNDDVSSTVGLGRGTSLVVLERNKIIGLSIYFLRPAKGRGWVELAAELKSQRTKITLLQSKWFSEDALAWLMNRKAKIEALFGVEISVNDGGADY